MRDTYTIGARRFVLWRWGAAGVLAAAAVVASCGGDDDANPTSAADLPSVATAAQTAVGSATVAPTATSTPPAAPANPFGFKIPTIDSVSSADDDRLTLPATAVTIDKLQIADPIGAGGSSLFIGISDGVVLAPAPGTIEKIVHHQDGSFSADAYLVTLRLKGRNRVEIWLPAAGGFGVKEGDTVMRGDVIARLTGRLDGPKTAGYSALLTLYGPTGGFGRLLNESQWVAGVPAALQNK